MGKIIILMPATVMLALGMNAGYSSTPSLDDAVGKAKAALARDLRIPETAMRLERAQAAEWPDSSLGCPQKGMQYLPVITPGYLVKLTVDERMYTVHVGAGRAVVCERALEAAQPSRAHRSERVLKLYQMAREKLAARLEIPQHHIRLKAIEPKTWPDSSLGCPLPSEEYVPVKTRGFVIELDAGGQTFLYHTDMKTVRLCDKAAPSSGAGDDD